MKVTVGPDHLASQGLGQQEEPQPEDAGGKHSDTHTGRPNEKCPRLLKSLQMSCPL